ncbi:protein YgfX [Sinimarinibacterium sp. CAU 1509]|uniref:protein YgfX n=1 Tax=Sinimarinibacterium sp. CAU 1509 TaxID=2562283 RepID=UPI00146F4B48|nr:protein YgfX [Sinimarinibacterium sp. CAU 1509]
MPSSSNSFASTVDLSLRPSFRALRWLFGLHALMLALLMASGLPTAPMLTLLAAIAGSWLWLRRHPSLGFGPQAVTRLIWHADGSWTAVHANGAQSEVELAEDSIVHSSLLLLRLRHAGRRRSISRLILGDELDGESLRRLRARLSSV